jgi:hypothetical protein
VVFFEACVSVMCTVTKYNYLIFNSLFHLSLSPPPSVFLTLSLTPFSPSPSLLPLFYPPFSLLQNNTLPPDDEVETDPDVLSLPPIGALAAHLDLWMPNR